MANPSQSRGNLGRRLAWRAGPPAILTVALALAYLPLFLGRFIYNRDLSRFLYPTRWFVRDSLARGDLPWWTPHIGLGHSLLADPQSALFYPGNLIVLLGASPRWLVMVMFLHLVWGAMGMARATRFFRLGGTAGLTAGVAWALSGTIASLWTNGARLPSAAWMPWQVVTFLGLARAAKEGQRPWLSLAGLGVATAMGILAGDVFVAIMGGMLGFGLALVWLGGETRTRKSHATSSVNGAERGGRALVRFLATAGLAVGLGLLLSAAAWLPAARALGGTERVGGVPRSVAEAGSFHPARAAELAAPEAFARAWYWAPNRAWVGDFLGGAPLSLSVYLGGSVLALVALAFFPLRRRGTRTRGQEEEPAETEPSTRTATLVAALGLLFVTFALGRYTPLHAALRALLPPLAYMRSPEKYLLAVVPCVALLAGWGAHRLVAAPARPSWRWGLCVPGLILLLALLAPALFPPDLAAHIRQRAWHGLLAATLVIAAWPLALRHMGLAGAYLLLVLVGDLALGSRLTRRFTDETALRQPALVRDIPARGARNQPFPRLFRGSKVQLAATESSNLDNDQLTLETLRENLGVPFGVANLPGYGVAIPPALTALLDQGRLDALRLLAVDYALLSAPRAGAAAPEGLSLVSTGIPGIRLYHVERALPRVFAAFAVERRPVREIADHLLDPGVVAGTTVLLDDRASWQGESHPGQSPLPCRLDEFSNLRLRATCDLPLPGLAVFAEQYAAGWSAWVDGAPTRLLQANAVMRAVPLRAGKHGVTLAFEPPGLRAGLWLSLLGAVAVAFLLLGNRRRV